MNHKIICTMGCLILLLPVLSTGAVANQPPPPPTISGQVHGKTGVLYSYGFCTKDPDGDNITITVNWGDESNMSILGPLPPNLCGSATHAWSQKGTYIISAKASDGQAESNWSSLSVTMPKDVPYQRMFFWYFETFPHVFPLLRYLWSL